MEIENKVTITSPGSEFNQELCLTPGLWTTEICPEIKDFMTNWTDTDVIRNYVKRHSAVSLKMLEQLLAQRPKFLLHAGLDFIYANDADTGSNLFLTIETNSCPDGLESMPPSTHSYKTQLTSGFFIEENWKMAPTEGSIAYLYEDIKIDTPSHPHFMAEISKEEVYMLPWYSKPNANGVREDFVKFRDGVMYVKDDLEGETKWVPIRACFRTLSAAPWIRIPVSNNLKTFMCPHPITCLTTGKNKLLANYAYEQFNENYRGFGLEIKTPRTVSGVEKKDIREIIKREFGFRAIIKTPYDGHGRGIYVVRDEADVDKFLALDSSRYNLFLVQDLIGFETDICKDNPSRYTHVGYVGPDHSKYAYSLRMIVTDSPTGYKLICICGARASMPFYRGRADVVDEQSDLSYITNIVPKELEGMERDIPASDDGVKRMGFTVDDVVDAYLQSVMCMLAIDQVCQNLFREDGCLDLELLKKLCPDPQLLSEVKECLARTSF